VGEERPNTDAKVFEVRVAIAEADTTLRPGMTTGNAIETFRVENALSVPLEALHVEEGVAFVYRLAGRGVQKQEVITGTMNDIDVVVLQGLGDDDRVLLAPPADRDRLELVRLDGAAAPTAATAGGDTAVGGQPLPAPGSPPKRD
jgi:hypothetical protein